MTFITHLEKLNIIQKLTSFMSSSLIELMIVSRDLVREEHHNKDKKTNKTKQKAFSIEYAMVEYMRTGVIAQINVINKNLKNIFLFYIRLIMCVCVFFFVLNFLTLKEYIRFNSIIAPVWLRYIYIHN